MIQPNDNPTSLLIPYEFKTNAMLKGKTPIPPFVVAIESPPTTKTGMIILNVRLNVPGIDHLIT